MRSFNRWRPFGGICDCQGSRDTLIYASSIDSRGLDAIVSILSEVILQPKISDQELDICRQTIAYELEDLNRKPEQEPLLLEQIHTAAYRGNTLGLPKICPEKNIPLIDPECPVHVPEHISFSGQDGPCCRWC